MSMFFSKALRRAEVFLEQVDESVAQASRRLVVEGATGAVDDDDLDALNDDALDDASTHDEHDPALRNNIPISDERPAVLDTNIDLDAVPTSDTPGTEHIPQETPVDSEFQAPLARDGAVDKGENIAKPAVDGRQSTMQGSRSATSAAIYEQSSDSDKLVAPTSTADAKEIERGTTQKPATDIRPSAAAAAAPDNSAETLVGPAKFRSTPSLAHGGAAVPALSASVSQPVASVTVPGGVRTGSQHSRSGGAESRELRAELSGVSAELEQSRRDRAKLVKNLKRMKEVVSELDEQLREKSMESRALSDELLELKAAAATTRKEQERTDKTRGAELSSITAGLNARIAELERASSEGKGEVDRLRDENVRLHDALQHGSEVDESTRHDAAAAHAALETEAAAHAATRRAAREREEALQEEAAAAAGALAAAQKRADEYAGAAAAARRLDGRLAAALAERDAACAAAGGERDAAAATKLDEMAGTVAELEHALETKNVELSRLQGEVELARAAANKAAKEITALSPGAKKAEARQKEDVEVEVRIRHMADSALRKQAQLEVLRSENRALQHQLSTERKRTREAQAMAAAASPSRQSIRGGGFRGILDGDYAAARDGPTARIRTPRNWPKHIAAAVTAVDRFSAQALTFLRREPLLRLVLVVYAVLLHLFVYALLHWHVDNVVGTADNTHGRIASAAK